MADRWRKVLRATLAVLLVAAVGAVGACGGGDDDDDGLPNECIAYCQNGCNKFVSCGYLPIDVVNVCADSCIGELENEYLTDSDACLEATGLINALTCGQLEDLFNNYLSAADIGKEIGRSCTK